MEPDLLNVENDPLQIYVNDEDTDYEDHDVSEEEDDTDSDDDKIGSDYEEIFKEDCMELKSLEKLCLKTVIKNLNRFTTAYDTSKDTTLRRNLVFLQRAYTETIIKEVKGVMNDSWLDFLLNEYLTEFHWSHFASCSHDAVLKRFESIGHVFLKVYISSSYAFNYENSNSPFLKKLLTLVPNVQTLHLVSSGDDEMLAAVAESCPQLKELSVDHSQCTAAGIKRLFKETEDGFVQPRCHLEVLSLKDAQVEVPVLVYVLRNMPSLKTLCHSLVPSAIYSMHKDGSTSYSLTSMDIQDLDLPHAELTRVITACAAVCPLVTRVQACVATQQHLEALSRFSSLEELALENILRLEEDNVDKLTVDPFLVANGAQLRELRLCEVSVSVKTLVEACRNLQSLYLRDVTLDGEGGGASLPRMRKLVLEHFEFLEPSAERSAVSLLGSCTKLEVLDLSRCEMAASPDLPARLNAFCERCSTLSELHFRLTDVQPELIESILLSSTSLKMLLIHDCENIMTDNVEHFYEIVRARKNRIKINWHSDRSTFNSFDGDFFDHDHLYHDEYDSDDLDPDFFGGFDLMPNYDDYMYGYEYDYYDDYDSDY